MDKAIDGLDFDLSGGKWSTYEEPTDEENWSSERVRERFIHTMIRSVDQSVGGQFKVAQSYWNAEIRVTDVKIVNTKKPIGSEPVTRISAHLRCSL